MTPGTERQVMRLVLYVAGSCRASRQAVTNLRLLLDEEPRVDHTLEIVDVLADPERAERDRILLTPTLVRFDEARPVRILGDLSVVERVRQGLGLPPAAPTPEGGKGEPA